MNRSQKIVSFGVIFALLFLITPTLTFARAVQYAPGETLNPDCSPGESNCNVAQLSVNTTLNTFGIGTTSPYAKLSVVGEVVATYFSATSTTATSTFAGGLFVGGGALRYDFSSGITSIDDLQTGPMTFDTNAGIVSWIDLPVTSAATAGTVESYSARIDGNSILTVYGESNGSGGIQNTAIGIGTSSPFAKLSVMGNAFFAGTMTASTINATSTTATSTFANGISITGGCIEIDGGCLAVGGGAGSPGGSSGQVQFNNGGGSFGGSSSFVWNNTTKRLGIGTTTPYAPLSVFGEVVASYFSATSTTATSTFANGIAITGGCLSVGGTCITANSSVIESGTQGQFAFYNGSGTTLTATSSVFLSQVGDVGVGTTSPTTIGTFDASSLRNVSQFFSSTKPQSVAVSGTTAATLELYATGGTANQRWLTLQAASGLMVLRALNDSGSTAFNLIGGNLSTGLVGIGTVSPTQGQLDIRVGSASTVGLAIRGASPQSADLQQWQNNAGTVLSLVDSDGNFGIGTTSPGQKLSVGGDILGNNIIGTYFTATSTTVASTLPYASSTAITADNLFATNFILSNLNGPIQANAGLISSTSSIGVLYGGTGITDAPAYGEILVGNNASGYTLTATSSLGLGTVLAGTTGQFPFYGANGSILTATSSLFLSDAGYVGIGTVTPSTELQVVGTITTTFASTTVISSSESAYFATGGGAHNVGIGTTSPWRTLSVNGTVAFANLTTPDVSGSFALCLDPATSEVYSSGGNTCTVSSARFKHNIESISVSGVSLVNQLRPVTFDLNGNNESHYGFIAEEVALVDRKMIFTDKGTTSPRGVRYEELTAVLAKAIQEQQVQIERLNGQSSSGVIAGAADVVLDGLRSFGVILSDTIARFRDVFVQTLHIENQVCVDDVCIGKEEFKTLLRNAGGVTVSAPPSTSGTTGGVATSTENASGVVGGGDTATTTESILEAGTGESVSEVVTGSDEVMVEPLSTELQTSSETSAVEPPASLTEEGSQTTQSE